MITGTEPTQVRRPWRATVRTAFAAIVGIAAMLPFIVEATGLDPEVYPWLGGILAVAAAVTRVMALEQVETFLRRFIPWLAAEPHPKPTPDERARVDILFVVAVALAVVFVIAIVRTY